MASMGPCSDEHGNKRGQGVWGRCPELQWGRALMSTEIVQRRIGAEQLRSLQWGRALMSTEICPRCQPPAWPGSASMGPCSDEHGNASTGEGQEQIRAASMGPCSDEHGNIRAVKQTEETLSASMGPCSDEHGNEATLYSLDDATTASMGPCSDEHGNSPQTTATRYPPLSLQWGRALMSTEI